jgi:hypothetical protein
MNGRIIERDRNESPIRKGDRVTLFNHDGSVRASGPVTGLTTDYCLVVEVAEGGFQRRDGGREMYALPFTAEVEGN